ncbi:hypothetical protein BH24CHL4_BH24CHL4_16210 [soil metagenome]
MQHHHLADLKGKSRFVVLMLAATLMAALALGSGTTAQTESTITGDYSVTIGREDIPSDLADGSSFAGRWIISFNADGSYSGERQDVGVVVTGEYEVNGNEVTITDQEGLVSCSNATAATIQEDDISSGTYEWAMIEANLTLVPLNDECGGRVVLLSSRSLTTFVPCTTEPLEPAAVATPAASPVAIEEPEAITAEETPDPDDPLAILTPDEPSDTGGDETVPGDAEAIGADIDELLGQMTACWLTGDPGQWLTLLSEEFRSSLIGNSPDFESTIGAAMTAPILWERAGDVEIENPTQVSAIVRTTVALEQDFQRFLFVLEDDEWRWDG